MTTYTVAGNGLEGVIVQFQAHPSPSFPVLHHTLNSVYDVDLYENDFHFLFDDVPTNGQTELYKDTPKQLLDYMISQIKTESRSVGTRSKTDKVETLFKTMQLRYKMNNGQHVSFKQGQKLVTAIVQFIKHQRVEVPAKCIEIFLATTRIYPSLIGIVDGLNMDKLFTSKQAIPAPTTSTATAAAGTGTRATFDIYISVVITGS